jgi:ligand-binding sensor domain-containing protein/class 3 adenylate cyclase
MPKHIIAIFFACALFSCAHKEQGGHSTIPQNDTFAPPKVTILADLPDSLQPKTVLLDTMPTPTVIAVPNHSGGSYAVTLADGQKQNTNLAPPVIKPLPVLLDNNGKPIRDSSGNTFIMGDGGLSNFTTFTTDDGLALDVITCSFKDKVGNLWFGTKGGGVSRYDPAGNSGTGAKSFITFSTAHGLANNTVLSIAEDKMGNLWFGSDGGGVTRYDGKSFTTFSTAQGLANNYVLSIAEDKMGNLWFGTEGGGVSRYSPSASLRTGSKSFTTFSTAHGLVNNNIRSIAEDKSGNLWFATDGGVTRYDPSASLRPGSKSFTTFSTAQGLANNKVRSITEDRSGNLWFATNRGVSRYSPSASLMPGSKPFTTFSTAQGLANNNVRSIAEDKTGTLWFATDGGGVSRYDPTSSVRPASKSFTTFSTVQGLASNVVSCIAEDKTGYLWFGTEGGGVSRYDGKSFTTFSTAQGLANNSVWSIAEEKTFPTGHAGIWFGTYGGGVSYYDGKSFTTFTTAQGLANNIVFSIAEVKTEPTGQVAMWFGTYGGGVSRYDRNCEPRKNTIKKDKKEVSKSFTTFSTAQGLANNIVRSIVEDKSGNLWFGTDGGASLYNGRSFTTFSSAQGLANNIVFCIAEDKTGNLWFGTDGGGVSRYGPSASSGTGSKSFTTFSTAQGLANNIVLSIAEDKAGNLWFGTAGGLSVLSVSESRKLSSYIESTVDKQVKNDKAKGTSIASTQVFKTFTKTDGLADALVTQVLQMPDGKMAVGTNLGITMFRPSADFTRLTEIEIYNSNTDCPVKDVNGGQGSMSLDRKGIIWAGTSNQKTALVRFDPSAMSRSKEPPTLVIGGVRVNEAPICWNDLIIAERETKVDSNVTPAYITEEVTILGRALSKQERDSVRRRFGSIQFDSIRRFYAIPEGLVLPYAFNHITFYFNAIETGKPKLVNYQYKLEGYDQDWSPVSKNSNATFGNIQEGSYTFLVKAQSPDGVWCAPVTYTFTVLPPWYRTWWAYCINAILFLLALRLFAKWRERKLRTEKANLERTVEERTEELVQKNIVVEKEKQRSEQLLLNILPGEVADELKANGTAAAKYFDNVTVLFTDFVGFSTASERMTPQELVDELHACFEAFDGIMGKYNIEKIKTVGDAYLAVCGLPQPAANHAENVINAALEIRGFMTERYAKLGSKTFQIRIGVHSGSLVAGIVGVKKFAYDVWGDTVNTAARMEQNSEPGKINISAATHELVKDKFSCAYRGEIAAKNKGMLKMYFVG